MADTEYRIVVDSTGAVREIDRFGRALDDAERSADELSDSLEQGATGGSRFNTSLLAAGVTVGAAVVSFNLLKNAVVGVFEGLGRGREVAEVRRSFEDLQRSVGQVGADTLPKLREATNGLIDDLTLMTEANKAVVLGLPTEGFEEAAAAAIKLGKAQGVDALGAIQALTEGVGKASPEILNNIGVVVRAEEAYQRFAQANGVTVKSLDDSERKIAIQREAYRQLLEESSKLTDGTDDVATTVQQLSTQWTNLKDRVFEAVNSNEALQVALGRVGEAIAKVDIDALINGLGLVVEAVADVINILGDLIGPIQSAFGFFVDTTADAVVSVIQFKDAVAGILSPAKASAAEISKLNNSVVRANGSTKQATSLLEKYRKEVVEINEITKRQAELEKKTSEQTLKLGREFIDSLEDQGEAVKKLERENEIARRNEETRERERLRAQEEQQRALRAAQEEYSRWVDQVEIAINKSDEYQQILRDLNSGIIDNVQAGERLKDLYNDKNQELTQLNAQQREYKALLEDIGRGADISADRLGELAGALGTVKEEAKPNNTGGGLLDDLFGGDVGAGIGQSVGGSIANALGSAISNAISGGSIRESIGGITSAIGGALGTAFGGPLGGAAGASFGQVIGDQLSKIGESTKATTRRLGELSATLGGVPLVLRAAGINVEDFVVDAFGLGDSPGTTARKAIDRYFGELFDGKRIFALIEGELQQITDFQFQGNQEGGGIFAGLSEGAQKSFEQVGLAFESLMGISADLAVNTGNVLANNLGGSLNNLQVVMERAGLSAEGFEAQLVETFLNGGKSAIAILDQLTAIQQLGEKGIPGALGATEEAFANLQEAGVEGGAFTVDALRDIASEAKELSIETLPALMSQLTASGRLNADAVKKLFEALETFGIDSVQQLEDVSDQTAIAILANLEANSFPFEETVQRINDIKDAIDDIPQNVDRTLRFRVEVDASSSDRDLLNQAQVELPFNGPAPGRG